METDARTGDCVDQAVDAWQKQMPRLETSSLQIASRLERIARHLDRRAGEALSDSGLSCRDLEVLGALCRSGCGMPAGQVAKAAMLTSGGMTGQADRLANAGFIVRKADPDDRRAVLMSLTVEGREVVEQGLNAYLGASERAVDVLDEAERQTLAALLRKLLVGLEGPSPEEAVAEIKPPASRPRDARPRHRFEGD